MISFKFLDYKKHHLLLDLHRIIPFIRHAKALQEKQPMNI
jgi:hypothetical protein